jgi:hypothetical protein
MKFREEVSSSDKDIASIQSDVSKATIESSPEDFAPDLGKKKHKKSKKSKPVEESHSSTESDVVPATMVIASKMSKKNKKTGVPALKDKNSGVLKVIEVCKSKRPALDSRTLELCEPTIGDGIEADW